MTAKLPTAIKQQKGTLKKIRENSNEPQPELFDTGAVAEMNETALAYREYAVKLMEKVGVASEMDPSSFDVLANTYAEWVNLNKEIEELDGRSTYTSVMKNGSEVIKPYPQYALRADAANRLLRLLQQFGMTPASRSNVSANTGKNKEDDNPFKSLKVV